MTGTKNLCWLVKIWGLREQNPLSGAKGCQEICPPGWRGPGQRDYPSLLNFAALDTTNSACMSEDRSSLVSVAICSDLSGWQRDKLPVYTLSDHNSRMIIPRHPILQEWPIRVLARRALDSILAISTVTIKTLALVLFLY